MIRKKLQLEHIHLIHNWEVHVLCFSIGNHLPHNFSEFMLACIPDFTSSEYVFVKYLCQILQRV